VRDDRTRLQDILEAVEHIEKYAVRGRAAFEQDELVQTWIIHHLLVLGEAAAGRNRLSSMTTERNRECV
jgi:uncharacterized protein with HEPN domain